VTASSYFEWVQDRQGYFWKEAVVIEQLEQHSSANAFDDVVRFSEAHQRQQPHRGVHAGDRSRSVHH
jgi:glutamate dehydrogenase/leucine dehydrogenase